MHVQTIPSLNGIRAISVMTVVLSHSGFGRIVPGGLGVTIFFFLSGYLITTLMVYEFESTARLEIGHFYVRRIFRLFPPLFITLIIAWALVAAGQLPGAVTLKGALAQVLYFANYYALFVDYSNSTIPAGTGILWSLAVEEHFYIFYPLLMATCFVMGFRLKTIGIFLAAACVFILLWRIYLVHQPSFVEARTYYASDTRIDSIMYGALLAFWCNPIEKLQAPDRMSRLQWLLLGCGVALLLISLVYRNPSFRETFRYSLQGVALFPLFYFAIRFHKSVLFRPLNSATLTKIGIWSYAIYLIHFIVLEAIRAHAPTGILGHPIAMVFFSMTISICYAIVIDKGVDPYFRRLRMRYHFKSRVRSTG